MHHAVLVHVRDRAAQLAEDGPHVPLAERRVHGGAVLEQRREVAAVAKVKHDDELVVLHKRRRVFDDVGVVHALQQAHLVEAVLPLLRVQDLVDLHLLHRHGGVRGHVRRAPHRAELAAADHAVKPKLGRPPADAGEGRGHLPRVIGVGRGGLLTSGRSLAGRPERASHTPRNGRVQPHVVAVEAPDGGAQRARGVEKRHCGVSDTTDQCRSTL